MPSHRWLISPSQEASEQISGLRPNERASLFAKIVELAQAENPYSLSYVEKYIEKRFNHQRKIRQGNYRMRFEIIGGEITHDKFVYKGRLVIISVKDRRDAYE